MSRLKTIAILLVLSSFFLDSRSSAILNYFTNKESSESKVDDDIVPEVYGGALTDFFQTFSVVGEGESNEDDLQRGEDDVEEVPEELNIEVEEFLLITDQELKARPRSDLLELEPEISTSTSTEAGDKSVKKLSDDVDVLLPSEIVPEISTTTSTSEPEISTSKSTEAEEELVKKHLDDVDVDVLLTSDSVSNNKPEGQTSVTTSLPPVISHTHTLQEYQEASSTKTLEPLTSSNANKSNVLDDDSHERISAPVSNLLSTSAPASAIQQTVSVSTSSHSSSYQSSLESNDSSDAPTGRAYLPVLEDDSVTTSDKLIPNQPLDSDTEISEPSVVVSPPPTTTVLSSLSSAVDSTSDDDSMDTDDVTTSFDELLLALEKLDTLNEAVEDLHTIQDQFSNDGPNDQSSGTDADNEKQDVAQDRTDTMEENENDDSDGLFAFLYNWLG